MKEKLSDLFYSYIRTPLKNLYTGIRNLIIWAPIIFKTRDWDWDFLMQMIQVKLQHMEKHLVSRDVLCTKVKKKLRKTIERIALYDSVAGGCADEYPPAYKKRRQKHEEKYGQFSWDVEPIEGSLSSRIKFTFTKVTDEKTRTKALKEWDKIHEKELALEEKLWNDIWDDLKANLRDYWD